MLALHDELKFFPYGPMTWEERIKYYLKLGGISYKTVWSEVILKVEVIMCLLRLFIS